MLQNSETSKLNENYPLFTIAFRFLEYKSQKEVSARLMLLDLLGR